MLSIFQYTYKCDIMWRKYTLEENEMNPFAEQDITPRNDFIDSRPTTKKTSRLTEAYNAVGYAIKPSLGVIGSWIGNKRSRTQNTALWTDGSVLAYKDSCIGVTSDDKDRIKYIVWPPIVDKGCSRILNMCVMAADIVNTAIDNEVVLDEGAPIELQDAGQAIVFNRIEKGEIEIGISKDV